MSIINNITTILRAIIITMKTNVDSLDTVKTFTMNNARKRTKLTPARCITTFLKTAADLTLISVITQLFIVSPMF